MRWLPLALTLGLFACGPSRTGPGDGGTVEGVWWVLERYADGDWMKTWQREPDHVPCVVWMTLANQGFQSNDCNNVFSGSAPISGARISFRIGRTTFGERGAFETAYQDDLFATRTFTATEDDLRLFDSANFELLIFRASATDPTPP